MEILNQPKFVESGNRLLNFTMALVLIFLGGWILILGKTIILPFMIALFLSFILRPVVDLLTRWKIPLPLAVGLTLIMAFIVLYLLGVLVYTNVQLFVGQFPVYQERLLHTLGNFTRQLEVWIGEPLNIQLWKKINWFDTLQTLNIPQNLISSLGTFLTFFLKIIIVIIFIAYLLTGIRNINHKIEVALPPVQASRVISIMGNVTYQVQRYLGTKTIVSLITGLISMIIFYSFGLDFAVFWAFIIFLFNFIPNIGSFIASLLPVIFSLLQFGSLSIAFWIGLSLTILQIAMGNIVEPRLMGRSLNLSPMIVIMSLIFWGYIWGVAGMILAVPILGTLTIIFENFESTRFLSVFFRGKPKAK